MIGRGRTSRARAIPTGILVLFLVASLTLPLAAAAVAHGGATAAANSASASALPPVSHGPGRALGSPHAGDVLANPSVCTQGSRTTTVNPAPGDMHNTLLSDYDALGEAGGGTLRLESGFYQIDETINFGAYGNVSIQGAGIGKTILSLPRSPIGTFAADNGSLVGVYDPTLNEPTGGVTANFIQLSGPSPVDNFEMCDLTVDAQANNASEDWSGSLIFDETGGSNHVYSDIAEVGFFGPCLTPNGFHVESSPGDEYPGVGYTIDDLYADNNSLPFENYSDYRGGPNFLNVGEVVECTIDNVTGIGQVAFEVAPPRACLIENWNVSGYVTIDPIVGGSWGGTLVENVSVSTNGTVASIALGSEVPGVPGYEPSNFSALRWLDDHFYGTVAGAANLVDVENSTFDGELNSTPAVFVGNTVTWVHSSPQRLTLPIQADGVPAGGDSSALTGDTFLFLNAVKTDELLQLNVPAPTWTRDTFEVEGDVTDYLMSAPGISLTSGSTLTFLTYEPLGGGAPQNLSLLCAKDSAGFTDLGATVGNLTLISDDLHSVPAMASAGPGPGSLADWAVVGVVVGSAAALTSIFVTRRHKGKPPDPPA